LFRKRFGPKKSSKKRGSFEKKEDRLKKSKKLAGLSLGGAEELNEQGTSHELKSFVNEENGRVRQRAREWRGEKKTKTECLAERDRQERLRCRQKT